MIEFKHINLSFPDKVVFQDFNWKVESGEKILISGKSGLGKSSLFHLILGFVLPQEGTVVVQGNPINEKNIWDIRKQIAYIDQDVSLPNLPAEEWFDFALGYKANTAVKKPSKLRKQLMEYFEFSKKDLKKNILNLSGGERQRIAIITCLLLQRNIFLLDEITASLDAHLKEKVSDYFLKNNEWTLIVISHDSVWENKPGMNTFNLKGQQWKP